MIIVVTAFAMVVAMGVMAAVKLEDEKRAEQFAKLTKCRNMVYCD